MMARRLHGALGGLSRPRMLGGLTGPRALGGLARPRCGLSLPRRTLSALAASAWHATTPLPSDPILGLVAAFKEDSAAQKVNLAQGAYRTDAGTPFVLASVMEAERRVAADLRSGLSDKEYLPIEGHAAFRRLSAELVLGGESPSLREGRVATLQTLSGTGALSVAAAALHRVGGIDDIYVPDPSWGNHQPIFTGAGLRVHKYTYLDERGTGLDFDGMARDLAALPRAVPCCCTRARTTPPGSTHRLSSGGGWRSSLSAGASSSSSTRPTRATPRA